MNCHRCDVTLGPDPHLLRLSRFHVFLCETCFLEAESHLDDCERRSRDLDGCTGLSDCPCAVHAETRLLEPVETRGPCQACGNPGRDGYCNRCRAELEAWFDQTDAALASAEAP